MDPSKENNKSWKKVAIFDTYELASDRKNKLIEKDESGELKVKIKRCGPEGTKFKIKIWHPDYVKPKSKKKKTKSTK